MLDDLGQQYKFILIESAKPGHLQVHTIETSDKIRKEEVCVQQQSLIVEPPNCAKSFVTGKGIKSSEMDTLRQKWVLPWAEWIKQ